MYDCIIRNKNATCVRKWGYNYNKLITLATLENSSEDFAFNAAFCLFMFSSNCIQISTLNILILRVKIILKQQRHFGLLHTKQIRKGRL